MREDAARSGERALESSSDECSDRAPKRIWTGSSGWRWRMFAVLAVLVWLTMGEGSVLVFGRPVEIS